MNNYVFQKRLKFFLLLDRFKLSMESKMEVEFRPQGTGYWSHKDKGDALNDPAKVFYLGRDMRKRMFS